MNTEAAARKQVKALLRLLRETEQAMQAAFDEMGQDAYESDTVQQAVTLQGDICSLLDNAEA